MEGWQAAGVLFTIAGVAALLALVRAPVPARAAAAASALLLAFHGWHEGQAAGAFLFGAAGAVALGQLGLGMFRHLRLRFTDEERRMAEAAFATLDRRQARQLFDQGVWIDGQAGETLTREGAPVEHLCFLSEGSAAVTSQGLWIATATAPTLVGEMTVLDESGATATVSLDAPARLWCVSAATLRLFLGENPDIRLALENSFFGSLLDKLRAANQAVLERSA